MVFYSIMEIQTNKIYPCIWFDQNAKEAASFYTPLFPGSSIDVDTPMVVNFNLNGNKFMGLNGGPMFQINPSISIFVYTATIEETNKLWSNLIEGGTAMMDINEYPWSKRYGWLKDKFGLTWQISVTTDVQTGPSISPSMLFTGDSFGKAAEAINFYSSIFQNAKTVRLIPYPEGDVNANKVMCSEIELNQFPLILMDGPGGHDFHFNEAISYVITCENQSEIDYYWDHLTAEGGNESRCGWLADKFGVSWQIVPSILPSLMSSPERAGRVMAEVMKMNKLIIQTLIDA